MANGNDSVTELQKVLKQQLDLVNAQIALETSRQTQDMLLATAVTEARKKQVSAQFDLESAEARLPLAELAGIKAALSGMQLPAGKSGTIQFSVGSAGAAMLRSKIPMLQLLSAVATELKAELKTVLPPGDAVIVTEAQLDQAYQSNFTEKRIEDQQKDLAAAIEATTTPGVQYKGLPQFAAAAYSAGFVLETVNSFAKLFRVDRKVDIFSADAEAIQVLCYMLESEDPRVIANPGMTRKEDIVEAQGILKKLNELQNLIHKGDECLSSSASEKLTAEAVTELKMQLEAAKSLLDGLHPSKKPDAFWALVKGKCIAAALDNKSRLFLEAKAQTLQIMESRWWRSDRVATSGEIQVFYRILDNNDKIQKTGIILKASQPNYITFKEMTNISFPSEPIKQGDAEIASKK